MADPEFEFIEGGSVTSPTGFQAGAVAAGISTVAGKLDLGILTSDAGASAAGVFTRNSLPAAPVVLDREHLSNGRARAVIVNSGGANAGTGPGGDADAREMAALCADKLGIEAGEVLVCSTGVIGERLPMDALRRGVAALELAPDGGAALARAIMTTDTVPKTAAVRSGDVTIGGAAKGSGMIHPDMATLLVYITTDAVITPDYLHSALARAAAVSFNMVSIDGDTSTNDSMIMLGGGASGITVSAGTPLADTFQAALEALCIRLAQAVVRDGEGANRIFEVAVRGAASVADARCAARTAVSSPLVKTAVTGADPNWGRLLAAIGRSGAAVVAEKLYISIGDTVVLKAGVVQPFDAAVASRYMLQDGARFLINLNLGEAAATAWGCDLTAEYVSINSEYTT